MSVCSTKKIGIKEGEKVSTSTLVELAEFVLKNNVFTVGKKALKHLRGTAIETKFVPPYSILFMTELEEEILREVELKPYLWWRCIDDIFFIWEHGECNMRDVTIYLENGKIKRFYILWKIYVNPTNTHQYLHSSSYHPYHFKKGIPYSQTLHFNRICSDSTSFDGRCNDQESP